ncbi:MAG: zinc-binding dehydrogenase [Melioribacteraceae bacterium]|nr:zinc-binding dehydrogenase [Melioribacteraceae bacterium]MCF8265665.1 zinc-binding dehydrogenase [Melioribacteraceae bacterium]MCF8414479.1 zinc-binding dehydrogenase [Melioribacteraceae bacterium]
MKMKAALLHGAHDWRIEEIDSPVNNDDELLISIRACGVCHSELHQWDEKIPTLDYPRFIGHEAAGIVKQSGNNIKKFKNGDRVGIWIFGKGFAEEVTVKEEQVFPLADDISFEEGALAEPISCTTNALLKTNLQLSDTVALVGTGFMGLILLQQLKHQGVSKIIAIDVRDEILEKCGQLGAEYILNPMKVDVAREIKELTDGRGVDAAFEVGGVQGTLDLVPQITRMEGKVVIFGYHPGKRIINDLGYWNWMAFDIINGHFRNMETILDGARRGMDMVNTKKIDMNTLITHKYKLDEIEEAFSAAKYKPDGFIKSVITI